MNRLLDILAAAEPVEALVSKLGQSRAQVDVGRLAGSLAVALPAAVFRRLGATVLVITGAPKTAEHALDDLVTLLGPDAVGFFPPRHLHQHPGEALAPGPRNERVEALLRLASGRASVLVTQAEALGDEHPDIRSLREMVRVVRVGMTLERERFLAELAAAGYAREQLVDGYGQFAVRGSLLDLFPFGSEDPIRVEFDGDEICSVRRFDPATQRSLDNEAEVKILLEMDAGGKPSRPLLELLPDDAVIFWMNTAEIYTRLKWLAAQSGSGEGVRGDSAEDMEVDGAGLGMRAPEHLRTITWSGLPVVKGRDFTDFGARRVDPFLPSGRLGDYLRSYASRGWQVWVAADTEGERERLEEQLAEEDASWAATVTPSLSEGFVFPKAGLVLLTTHELFQRRRMRAHHRRFRRRPVNFDRLPLTRGDLVVHSDYGIGRYEGLALLNVNGQPSEALKIRYQDDVVLYVHVDQMALVEKYVGSDGNLPPLSRIGTAEWARTKARTRRALQDMSAELIRIYARRKVIPAHAFGPDTYWQRELEASFEFTDTPDQALAAEEVKADLQKPYPMDRLLCGDVGFGKTEVAVRAAFKVVQESHQVAVLVPTTILAQQHYETFRNRLAQYPIRIEVLSRFRSPAEQRRVVSGLKDGSVDIVIGTHRLLSKDVGFQRLGLLVVDEEHRFGVRHKEKLKALKADVHVLTMTATPIPRTLQLALSGARDTSHINTPPMDRLPVQTEVVAWSEEVIREAILREIDRQGQVFFVHNRVQSLGAVKGMLERIVPGLRYAAAHGQMPERDLEQVMVDFMQGRYDVLVTTMIIEAGLDIPNANTLLVNRADRFGLAQLYQLRGRIGRSNRQAYAYFLIPPGAELTADARRRLQTIVELTELGSGMKVALRDLEIRGAGNLLGAEQSGFINAVGFDLYTRLLEEAVAQAKGEPLPEPAGRVDVKVEFPEPAYLPPEYVDDGDLRYDVYRRLARLATLEQVDALRDELTDRFGPLPEPVGNLLDLMKVKLLAASLRVTKVALNEGGAVLTLQPPEAYDAASEFYRRLVTAAGDADVEFRSAQTPLMCIGWKDGKALAGLVEFLQRACRVGILAQ